MTLTQTGSQVTGSDGSDDFSGTVAGMKVTGRWSHGSDGGPFELTMESSCNRFTGLWNQDANPRRTELNGTRTSGSPTLPAPGGQAPPPGQPSTNPGSAQPVDDHLEPFIISF